MAKNISYYIDFDTPAWKNFLLNGHPAHYNAGCIVNLQGEKPSNLLFISHGIIKHTSVLLNGSEKTLVSIPADFTPPVRNRKPLIPEKWKPAFR